MVSMNIKNSGGVGGGGGSLNGVYSSLFRAKASGGHSKARETRDAQFLQKVTRFALISVGPARPRPCKCPPTSDTCQSVAILMNRPHSLHFMAVSSHGYNSG